MYSGNDFIRNAVLFFSFLGAISVSVHAVAIDSSKAGCNSWSTVNDSIDFGVVYVPKGSVNDVVATRAITAFRYSCANFGNGDGRIRLRLSASGSGGAHDPLLIPLNNTSFGVKLSFLGGGDNGRTSPPNSIRNTTSYESYSFPVVAELIPAKVVTSSDTPFVGEITAYMDWWIDGCTSGKAFGNVGCDNSGAKTSTAKFNIRFTSVSIVSCELDAGSKNKIVNLDPISVQDLNAGRSNEVAFSLGYTCDTSKSETSPGIRNAHISLVSTTGTAGEGDIVKNAVGPEKATGVGIQVLHEGKIVKVDGSEKIPLLLDGGSLELSAKYKATGEDTAPGTVEAKVNILMEYQ